MGCLDEIDLPVPAGAKSAIVVNGQLIYGDPTYVVASVEQIFAFDANSRKRIPSKGIQLINDSGQSIDLELEFLSTYTKYIPLDDPSFKIELGRSYKIRAETLNNGIFESEFDQLTPVPSVTEIAIDTVTEIFFNPSLQQYRELDIAKFNVRTPLMIPGQTEKARLLWQTPRIGNNTIFPQDCDTMNLITITRPKVFDGNTIQNLNLERKFLAQKRINSQRKEYCFTLIQGSLSAEAFTYWQSVELLLEQRTGSILETTVGDIQSNIKSVTNPDETVYGLFYATQQDTFILDQ